MVKTFIFRDLGYHGIYYMNNPNLEAVGKYFRDKNIDMEEIKWSGVHLIDYGTTGSYHIQDCTDKIDFSSFSKSGKTIVLNGSGKYHHRTFFLVKYSNHDNLSYVQLDAHTDFGPWEVGSDFVNSGGFVEDIVDLDKIRKALLLGIVPSEVVSSLGYGEGMGFHKKYIPVDNPPIFNEKTELYLLDNLSRDGLSDIQYELLIKFSDKYKKMDSFSPSLIPTDDVYLTIDLDVVDKFITCYRGLGKMTFEGLLDIVSSIGEKRNIVAADICGLDLGYLRYEEKDDALIYLQQIYELYVMLRGFMCNY